MICILYIRQDSLPTLLKFLYQTKITKRHISLILLNRKYQHYFHSGSIPPKIFHMINHLVSQIIGTHHSKILLSPGYPSTPNSLNLIEFITWSTMTTIFKLYKVKAYTIFLQQIDHLYIPKYQFKEQKQDRYNWKEKCTAYYYTPTTPSPLHIYISQALKCEQNS